MRQPGSVQKGPVTRSTVHTELKSHEIARLCITLATVYIACVMNIGAVCIVCPCLPDKPPLFHVTKGKHGY